MKNIKLLIAVTVSAFLFSSCQDGVFLFSIEDDKMLGAEVDAQIEADPQFNIVAESANPQAYAYLNEMKNIILNSGEVKYADEFVWELHIIDEDSTLNAFATPGGYIYVYTGLIYYLDDAASLAGVMGHEIAHADRRHSSKQLQKNIGISALLEIVTGGNPNALANLTQNLLSLSFSRGDETDADNGSVDYLCPTTFEADGAANFFQKIIDSGAAQPPQFLSTHPNPDNRVENIQTMAADAMCGTQSADPMVNGISYDAFKALL